MGFNSTFKGLNDKIKFKNLSLDPGKQNQELELKTKGNIWQRK